MRLINMIIDIAGIWFGISMLCTVIGMKLDGRTFESYEKEVQCLVNDIFKDEPYEVCKFAFDFICVLSVAILGPLFIADAYIHKKQRKRAEELQKWADKELAEMKDKGLIK